MTSNHESEVWTYLLRDPPYGLSLTARTAFPDLNGEMLAAIDSYGHRHFLIPVSAEEVLTDNRSRGIGVATRELQIKGGRDQSNDRRYLDIQCLDVSSFDAFDLIGHQIATCLSADQNSKTDCVTEVLARWRYFWGRAPGNILSETEIIGLFTELWFLYHWLFPLVDHARALAYWRGPFGARHDFELPDRSVEAKGTTSQHERKHWIHGIDQLSPPENGSLYLFSLRLRQENGADNNLPALIGEIRSHLKDEMGVLDAFENSIFTAGYSPAHDEEYYRFRFRIVDEALYVVDENFPRITPELLKTGNPPGVTEVDYEISLDGFEEKIIARSPDDAFIH